MNPCIQCVGEMRPWDTPFVYSPDGYLDFRGCLYRYSGRAGQAIRLLKYQRKTSLAPFLASTLFEAIKHENLDCDLTVPIPIHWRRLTWRGFNQADLMAMKLDNVSNVVRRSRPTQPQAGLTADQRSKNLEDAFEVTGSVNGLRILLVDDVVTSGRTANECAKALKLAGAIEVGILAFCGDTLSPFTESSNDLYHDRE